MSTLTEIETAIEQLSPAERAKLANWWQKNFDLDEGLELREDVARELGAAKKEVERGDVSTWEQVKRTAKTVTR